MDGWRIKSVPTVSNPAADGTEKTPKEKLLDDVLKGAIIVATSEEDPQADAGATVVPVHSDVDGRESETRAAEEAKAAAAAADQAKDGDASAAAGDDTDGGDAASASESEDKPITDEERQDAIRDWLLGSPQGGRVLSSFCTTRRRSPRESPA